MIHYQLRCHEGHEFDGWFKDSAGFDQLAQRGLVECPTCGDTRVTRALMAPAVATRDAPDPAPRPEEHGAMPPRVPVKLGPGGRIPAHLLAALQRMRAEVEKNCDYVGSDFANEARRMHRGESDRRGIYGETTREEAEALSEEGIEIASIPWVPRADG